MLKKLLIIASVALISSSAMGASFMKIDSIPGESKSEAHKDEIEVLSWSFNSAKDGRTVCTDGIQVAKYIDKATPLILRDHLRSAGHAKAVLSTTARTSAGMEVDFMTVTLENVSFSSVSMGASSGSHRQTEMVNVKFDRMTLKYVELSGDGKGSGTATSETVDVVNCK